MVLDEVKDKYKEYAKFFQEYDRPPQHEHQPIATKEKNLDPFKKINWKNLYDSNELNRFHYKLIDDSPSKKKITNNLLNTDMIKVYFHFYVKQIILKGFQHLSVSGRKQKIKELGIISKIFLY